MLSHTTAPLPLEGITVIELGTIIAGPFAGSLLAEMGANVIKIEQPHIGDGLRLSGPQINEVSIWWGVATRNKKCITLNLKKPEGIEIFKQLIKKADVLIENYRPGVLDKLGIGKEVLHGLQNKLIILSISGYGQHGSYASKPGFGKIAEGLSGIIPLTGHPDEPPLYNGFSLADTSAGLYGSFIINLFLLNNNRTHVYIDLALYEPLLEMLEFQFHNLDNPATRQGTNNPYGWGIAEQPISFPAFQSEDKQWFQIRFDSKSIQSIRKNILLKDSTDLMNELKKWSLKKSLNDIKNTMNALEVPFSIIQNGESLANEKYFHQRKDILNAHHPKLGNFPVPGFFPKYPRTHSDNAFRAPQLGEDNEIVFKEFLKISVSEYQKLIDGKII
jgi:formyl-CoA transferase